MIRKRLSNLLFTLVHPSCIVDLLVGAYSSQQVFLLRYSTYVCNGKVLEGMVVTSGYVCAHRTRAVANVQVTLSAEPNIVNLQTDNCTLGADTYSW